MTYEVVTSISREKERVRRYSSDDPLAPGERAPDGWPLLARSRASKGREARPGLPRVLAKPARYRLRLRHPDGHEELGAMRRLRSGSPDGWVTHSRRSRKDSRSAGRWSTSSLSATSAASRFSTYVAERDYAEAEGSSPTMSSSTRSTVRRRGGCRRTPTRRSQRLPREGLDVELVALDPGEEPDWAGVRAVYRLARSSSRSRTTSSSSVASTST